MLPKDCRLAIVGATGLVGETLLTLIDELKLSFSHLSLVASERSAGQKIQHQGKTYTVEALSNFDFSTVDVAIFSAGREASRHYAPKAVDSGCWVIDNSSEFRYDAQCPLIIPEVNIDHLSFSQKPQIISNPNCSTIQMLVALKPLHEQFKITTIQVATYQAVSGQGAKAIGRLKEEAADFINDKKAQNTKPIAFNVLPEIDTREPNGFTREEMKMVWETQKIFDDKSIKVNPTAVRVPVVNGHGMAIHIETERSIDLSKAEEALLAFDGVIFCPYLNTGEYPTQLTDAAGSNEVFVGRLRKSLAVENGLNLWVVADNLRKGAAWNALQILLSENLSLNSERLLKLPGV